MKIDKFTKYLILSLAILGIMLLVKGNSPEKKSAQGVLEVNYFFHPTCSHCKEQKSFNEYLKKEYPQLTFIYHDITDPKESSLLSQFALNYNVPVNSLGVPATFFGKYHFVGFDKPETTGKEIEKALKNYLSSKEIKQDEETGQETPKEITLPFLGNINPFNYSLPALAVTLGLIDGFNPCAMWVLVYLISLILSINDRKKIWLLVGSFVLASGILYFLFMTAWLNAFLFIGYLRPLTLIIGLWAIGSGVIGLREYIKTKGAIACKVENPESKQKTIGKIEKIVLSPLTITTIFGIIALAFIINSIEFACSSAIPAVFTQVLAVSNLSIWQYYAYILLYDLFFMLDDLIIFGLAAFAINTAIGEKYAKYCKLIGGVILFLLGILLVFAPNLLR